MDFIISISVRPILILLADIIITLCEIHVVESRAFKDSKLNDEKTYLRGDLLKSNAIQPFHLFERQHLNLKDELGIRHDSPSLKSAGTVRVIGRTMDPGDFSEAHVDH